MKNLCVQTPIGSWIRTSAILALLVSPGLHAQNAPVEKSFPQSKAAVERALKSLQSSLSGHLPTLDGFAQPGERSFDRYQRAFFQTAAQVSSAPSGGSLVRVSAKVTAWYNDPLGAHSGYQVLNSNGRLESDLLDQLTEQLGQGLTASSAKPTTGSSKAPGESAPPHSNLPTAPAPPKPSFSVNQSLADQERASVKSADKAPPNANTALQAEADSLSEVLKNQGHPKNLVAVKKSGTPVVASPSLTAKPQFLASMHDEFEMLDFNRDWVHVRISGLSRGWVWRNSVEMPNGIADTDVPSASAQAAADLFRVSREETAPFPGDWAPLRGKNVKIISVQKLDEAAKEGGPTAKLEYTKFLLDKNYAELVKTQGLAGMVVIFDSADGGMIAATVPTLQQWRAGTLTDSALWHKCFFDPPETFDSTGSSASQ